MEHDTHQERELQGYASVRAAQPVGAHGELITIEADLTRGLHSFSIVGLPDKAVEEAKDRIAAAIRHSGCKSPKQTNKKIVLSLAPADVKKEGSHYDVALALCYLGASGDITLPATASLFIGELGLDGSVRKTKGVLSQVIAAKKAAIHDVYVPHENVREALLAQGMRIYALHSLRELLEHLSGTHVLSPVKQESQAQDSYTPDVDFTEVKGQESAKRALEVAAAGRHNVVLYGPPGTGKTLLARALTGILPPLTQEEVLEVTAIHSTAGTYIGEPVLHPPFRSPHHTISHTAMVGGGVFPKAGEVTLAHKGVLFLDELPEFDARTLEALRQPLEDRVVTVSRTRGTVTFPADTMVVAAMNPAETLSYDAYTVARHAQKQSRKISRPIIDRLDIWIEVPHIPHETLAYITPSEPSLTVRARVMGARERARVRQGMPNGGLSTRDFDTYICASEEATRVLVDAAKKLSLSPRAYHRVLRVARTIADLENSEAVHPHHVLEALQFRPRGILGTV